MNLLERNKNLYTHIVLLFLFLLKIELHVKCKFTKYVLPVSALLLKRIFILYWVGKLKFSEIL